MKLELETISNLQDNQLYHKIHEILIFNYKTNMHFKCVKTKYHKEICSPFQVLQSQFCHDFSNLALTQFSQDVQGDDLG